MASSQKTPSIRHPMAAYHDARATLTWKRVPGAKGAEALVKNSLPRKLRTSRSFCCSVPVRENKLIRLEPTKTSEQKDRCFRCNELRFKMQKVWVAYENHATPARGVFFKIGKGSAPPCSWEGIGVVSLWDRHGKVKFPLLAF